MQHDQRSQAGPQAEMLGSRYQVYGEIASGGMASVQYGKLLGPRGFSRPVAVKRLHAHFSKDPDFVSMFLDEARLSARLMHANIIHTLDVIETPDGLALVMEYVHGESLLTLLRLTRAAAADIPVRIGCALIASVLHGLHTAHSARDDAGSPLHIVHRDVSPHNILIGSDGVPRVLDFGIAKALGRLRTTPQGEIRGKLGYIACEQLHAQPVDARTDIYGAAVVLWEVLTGVALFEGPSESAIVHRVLYDNVAAPSELRGEIPPALDAIVLRALRRDPSERFDSAREMALTLEREIGLASQSEVATWLQELAGERLQERSVLLGRLQDGAPSAEPQAAHSGTRKVRAAPVRVMAPAAVSTASVPVHELDAFQPIMGEDELLGHADTSALQGADHAHSRRSGWLAGVLCLCLLAGLGVLYALRSTPVERLAPKTASQARKAAMPVAIPVTTPLTAAAPVEPPALEPATAQAFEIRTPVLPKPLQPLKPRTHARKSAVGGGAAAGAQAAPCALYYNVDAKGIRRPRPECL